MNLIEKAARIAIRAHEGQKRKGDGFPYIVHPFMVATKLLIHDFSEEVAAAGLVHDVLEDSDFSEEELRNELGDAVARIVVALSEDKSLPWEERKRQYARSVAAASESVKAVAAADKIHNLESMLRAHEELGSNLWEKFNSEREQQLWFAAEMLAALKKNWQHPLIDEYALLVGQQQKLM